MLDKLIYVAQCPSSNCIHCANMSQTRLWSTAIGLPLGGCKMLRCPKPCLLSGGGTGQAAADFLLAVVRQGHVDDFLIRGDDAVKALVRLDQAELAACQLFDCH